MMSGQTTTEPGQTVRLLERPLKACSPANTVVRRPRSADIGWGCARISTQSENSQETTRPIGLICEV